MVPYELLQDLNKLVCSSRNKKVEDLFIKLANEDDDNIKLDIGNDIEINMDTINLSNALELDSNPILNDIEIL